MDSSRFLSDRSRLLEAVSRESQKVIDSFDRRKEARELADDARNAVAAAAAVSASGVGLGAIVTIAATTAAADVTGIEEGQERAKEVAELETKVPPGDGSLGIGSLRDRDRK